VKKGSALTVARPDTISALYQGGNVKEATVANVNVSAARASQFPLNREPHLGQMNDVYSAIFGDLPRWSFTSYAVDHLVDVRDLHLVDGLQGVEPFSCRLVLKCHDYGHRIRRVCHL